jgi:RNA 3'-terminal phosphate cyclase (ATP)
VREVTAAGPGHALLIELIFEHVTEVFTGFGEKGVRPEEMAEKAAREAREYLDAQVPVGPHLADQLLLPLALAGAGRFVTVAPTLHTTTNMDVIRRFLGVDLRCEPQGDGRWSVSAG